MSKSTTVRRRKPVHRSLKIIRPIQPDGSGAIRITAGKVIESYAVQTYPAFDGTCIGVAMRKHDGTVYDVCLAAAAADTTCDCLGHTQHRRCKHVDALQALSASGRLPLPAQR